LRSRTKQHNFSFSRSSVSRSVRLTSVKGISMFGFL
jgi:hypothetical protein